MVSELKLLKFVTEKIFEEIKERFELFNSTDFYDEKLNHKIEILSWYSIIRNKDYREWINEKYHKDKSLIHLLNKVEELDNTELIEK